MNHILLIFLLTVNLWYFCFLLDLLQERAWNRDEIYWLKKELNRLTKNNE